MTGMDSGTRRDSGRRDSSATGDDTGDTTDGGDMGDGPAQGMDAALPDLGLPTFDGSLPSYTYWQDIRPILARRCLMCHSSPPKFGAPTSEATYADTQVLAPDGLPEYVHMGWSVENTTDPMPPSTAPPATQDERDMIYIWSITGAAQGIAPDGGIMDASSSDAASTDATPDGGYINPLPGFGMVTQIGPAFGTLGGIRWRASTQTALFTDITNNEIHQLIPPSTFDMGGPFLPNAQEPYGINFDTAGLLLLCQDTPRSVVRRQANGTFTTVAAQYMGQNLNSPNDIVVRSDGTIYFTDPTFGLNGRTRGVAFNGVYRVDLQANLHAEFMGATTSLPNGLTLSPDEQTFYFSDTASGQVHAYDVNTDGSLANSRVFVGGLSAPQGLVTDNLANLYVATMGGISIYAPDGHAWGTLQVPTLPGEGVGTMTFGGPQRNILIIISRTQVFTVQAGVTGRN
jgi:gluconolactonase